MVNKTNERRRLHGKKQHLPADSSTTYVDTIHENHQSFKKYCFATSILLCIVGAIFYAYWVKTTHNSLQKSHLPKALYDDLYNETNWSTLRPHTYFGLKTKHPNSPLFGLLWYQQPMSDVEKSLSIRHWCEHGDNTKFSWDAHDGRSFGRESIEDNDLHMQIDWLANGRKSFNIQLFAESNKTYSLVFYMATQDDDTQLFSYNTLNNSAYTFLNGYSPLLGHFVLKLRLPSGYSNNGISSIVYKISPKMDMRYVDKWLQTSMGRRQQEYDLILIQKEEIAVPHGKGANFAAVQFTFSGEFYVELEFLSSEDDPLKDFSTEFSYKLKNFEQKCDQIFPIQDLDSRFPLRKLGQIALSNLLGGIGVWHGYSLARIAEDSADEKVLHYGPLSLISAVPSRPFFPRGFLWDEGFHNLIIRHFDPILTLQILASWLDTLSVDGWIPREMVLDKEAQAKVPTEFLVQSPHIANPPMFFFVLEKFLKNSEIFKQHYVRLSSLYPRLKQFYIWLKETQKGPLLGTMQWQGRNRTTQRELNPKCLPSGLDDFPRATHPSSDEYHLDLRCWMAFSSKVLRQLAENFGDHQWVSIVEEDVRLFNDIDSLNRLHWSDAIQGYTDFGLHSDRVQLVQKIITKRESQKTSKERIFIRKTIEEPRLRLIENVFGYVNLFPMLLRLLPADNAKLGILLRSLNQTEHLWTPFGLRSLSTKSPYYMARNTEHDAPYWRGPIWININYLALDALHHYANSNGPFVKLSEELYSQLRANLIRNIAEQYMRTGFLWEQYNDKTGEGMGTRPFTGWTALIVNIMAEKFD